MTSPQVEILAGGCPHKHDAPSKTATEPAAADKKCDSKLSDAYSTPSGTQRPLSYIQEAHDGAACPVVSVDPANYSFTNDNQPISGGDGVALPTLRQVSSIPRSASESASEKSNASTSAAVAEEYWVYPSQMQFYNSMKRKNFEPSEDDMAVVVSMHNVVNEMTWKKILSWEQKYKDTCGNPKLKRFGGKPENVSPKARLLSFFGYSMPFDRHDWIVDRCGKEVPYVIDYYTGSTSNTNSLVAMFIDARPAVYSMEAAYDRVERFFKLLF